MLEAPVELLAPDKGKLVRNFVAQTRIVQTVYW